MGVTTLLVAADLGSPFVIAATPPVPAAGRSSGAGASPAARTSPAGSSAAAEVVGRLHETFVNVLRQAGSLGYKGRAERLAPALQQALDVEFMARTTLGRQWDQLGPDDRARWVRTFADFTIANYAGRLDHDAGQTFETLGEEAATNDTVLIRTRVLDPAGETIDLAYRLRKNDGGWKIIDVYVKGTVSELALRRAEYSSVLKRDGFDALLALLQQRTAELAAGKTAQ